jgi:replicative DNA helicase
MQSSFITNNGIPSGFPSLDKITGGWKNRDLIVVGSRPTVGNTAFGLNVAVNVAMNMHLPVMFYSLEMSTEYIAKRLLYSHANAEGNIVDRISNLDEPEWQQLEKRLLKLAKAPIYINDTPCLGISDFREKTKKLLSETGVRLIIIDYLQLMRRWPEDRGKRIDEVNHIVQTLKETAVALGVPIIVLSQLNRLIRKDGSAHLKPTLKDIRETSAVEECADMVILLDRPSEKEIEEHPEMEGEAEFIVAVNKHGRTGSVPMRFDKDSLSFVDPLTQEDSH